MKERWVVPFQYPSYAVSSYGRVVNRRRDTPVTTRFNQRGIKTVSIVDRDGRLTMRSLAVLVAEEFIEKPESRFNTIIHFNNDRDNCRVDNLDWRPRLTALNYHRQFRRHIFLHAKYRFEQLDTGERFTGFVQPCTRYGLYFMHLLESAEQGVPAFPTPYRFTLL